MAGLAGSVLAFAPCASAEEPRPLAIWYRASENCPAGPDFLAKLAETGHPMRLAHGGDHIDFVVTLLAADSVTVGRLERQTDAGTVAIRELRDATCERVAEALALSLGLAVDPHAAEPALPEPAADAASVPVEPTPEPASNEVVVTPAPRPRPVPAAPSDAPRASAHQPRIWSLGLAVGALSGVATHPVARGEVFINLDRLLSHGLPELSLRLGLIGAAGSFSTPGGAAHRSLFAARAEACPVAFGSGRFAVRPCLVNELGLTRVAREQPSGAANSLWWAPGVALRGELEISHSVRLEAAASALLPLPRHEISSARDVLYRDAIVAFSGTLGASFALP